MVIQNKGTTRKTSPQCRVLPLCQVSFQSVFKNLLNRQLTDKLYRHGLVPATKKEGKGSRMKTMPVTKIYLQFQWILKHVSLPRGQTIVISFRLFLLKEPIILQFEAHLSPFKSIPIQSKSPYKPLPFSPSHSRNSTQKNQ